MNYRLLFSGIILCLLMSGCQTARLESYVNPGYNPAVIKRVAILPISNARLSAGNAAEVASSFAKAVARRNSSLALVSGSESVARLNSVGKADVWSEFLRNYSNGGIPNTNSIKDVASSLEVDAIIQGTILEIKQEDSNGYSYPMTRVVLRYTMFNAVDGAILWEVTGDGAIQPYSYKAVPIFEALKLANDKVLDNLPL
jgi:hypothetical protein